MQRKGSQTVIVWKVSLQLLQSEDLLTVTFSDTERFRTLTLTLFPSMFVKIRNIQNKFLSFAKLL